ncbi:hypothetical protein EJ04DRAFT_119173 [Polyplosphaeria fusca]|uniref:Uncharacterized protein n=1 Tax=Polyplosphaeria fusca TaxID=682080 RepID=A0A9P4R3M3_9PLEO|nr:hypothetical protein EJ04DRAFT_119173 [Polyplosphaeria fusca]
MKQNTLLQLLFFLFNFFLCFGGVDAFLKSYGDVGRDLGLGQQWKRDRLFPRELPGDGEEDETGSGLSSCLPRCGAAKSIPDPSKHRRDVLSTRSDSACAAGDFGNYLNGCMNRPDNVTNDGRVPIRKRALPTGDDDLRKKTREQLGEWITERVQYDNDVKLIWDGDDEKQYIQMELLDGRGATYPIPTSFWIEPGNKEFAWGTIGLVGCSLMTAVKDIKKDSEDKTTGVYMAHYWEVPAWDIDEEDQKDDEGNVIKKDVKIMNAQSGSYIYDFMRKGFPPAGMRRRIDSSHADYDETYANPTPQDSITQHADNLKGAFALFMHPQTTIETPPDSNKYVLGDGPQYDKTLEKAHGVMQEIMKKKDSNFEIQKDYLYRPDREHKRYETTQSGRSIFEYQPNFEGRKTGMLLYEDGGEQGKKNKDGTYEPGPGGPFWFDFGPAEEDTDMGGT